MAWPGSDAGGGGNWVWLFDFLVGTEHQVLGGLMDAQGTAFLWGVLPGTQEKEGPHRAGMGEWLRGMRLGGGRSCLPAAESWDMSPPPPYP